MTNFGKLVVTLIVLVVALAAAYFLWLPHMNTATPGPVATSTENGTGGMLTYTSEAMGISFSYPDSYVVDEKDMSGGERSRHSIVLMRKVDLPLPQNGEGPTAITIDAYQNDLDGFTAGSWIRSTNDSNFKLSPDGLISTSTLAGETALSYSWSGLYEGNTTVVARPDWVYAFSVTHLTQLDEILADYETLMGTIRFTE